MRRWRRDSSTRRCRAASRLPRRVALNALRRVRRLRARTVALVRRARGAAIGITSSRARLAGWTLLLVTFVAATVASRLGLQRKMLLGIAEERGGRRGAGNAIANTGVAAIAALSR
jgi:uncharacterized membrane protein